MICIFIYGFVPGLIGGLILWPSIKIEEMLFGIFVFELSIGLMWGLRSKRQTVPDDIQTVERLNWSWKNAQMVGSRSMSTSLIVGPVLMTIIIFVSKVSSSSIVLREMSWPEALFSAAGTGVFWGPLVAGLIGFPFGGLYSSIMETKTLPYQGIRMTIKNIFLSGLIIFLITCLIIIVSLSFLGWPVKKVSSSLGVGEVLVAGLSIGLSCGIHACFWFGGLDIIQHYILRFILYHKGYTPFNYVRFLNHATDLIFLQKVGGGYIFIHRLLLEHFAAMPLQSKTQKK